MSTSYDIDHEADTAKALLRAIKARCDGVFDHPDLLVFGKAPLGTTLEDITDMVAGVELYPDPEED